MNLIIILTLSVLMFFLGTLIGYLKYRRFIINKLCKGTGKMGIIHFKSFSASLDFKMEIEEIESAGDFVKVKVIDVKINTGSIYDRQHLLKSVNFNEWVYKSLIIWYDDNSQRIREEKINSIFNEK